MRPHRDPGDALETVAPTVAISTAGTTTNQTTQTIAGRHSSCRRSRSRIDGALSDPCNGGTRPRWARRRSAAAVHWSTSVMLSGNGSDSIVAQDTDAAGNPAAARAWPSPGDDRALDCDHDAGGRGQHRQQERGCGGVTISGTATAGSAAINGQTATITIVDSSNVVKDTYTATVTNGTWSVNVTAAQAQALADGSYSIKANVSDAAGNAASTATQAIALETVAPTVAISTAGHHHQPDDADDLRHGYSSCRRSRQSDRR